MDHRPKYKGLGDETPKRKHKTKTFMTLEKANIS